MFYPPSKETPEGFMFQNGLQSKHPKWWCTENLQTTADEIAQLFPSLRSEQLGLLIQAKSWALLLQG